MSVILRCALSLARARERERERERGKERRRRRGFFSSKTGYSQFHFLSSVTILFSARFLSLFSASSRTFFVEPARASHIRSFEKAHSLPRQTARSKTRPVRTPTGAGTLKNSIDDGSTTTTMQAYPSSSRPLDVYDDTLLRGTASSEPHGSLEPGEETVSRLDIQVGTKREKGEREKGCSNDVQANRGKLNLFLFLLSTPETLHAR